MASGIKGQINMLLGEQNTAQEHHLGCSTVNLGSLFHGGGKGVFLNLKRKSRLKESGCAGDRDREIRP